MVYDMQNICNVGPQNILHWRVKKIMWTHLKLKSKFPRLKAAGFADLWFTQMGHF